MPSSLVDPGSANRAAPKLFWKIPEAGHTGGCDALPREYTRRVPAFFDSALRRPLDASRRSDASASRKEER